MLLQELRRALRRVCSWETLLFFRRDLDRFSGGHHQAREPVQIRPATQEEVIAWSDSLAMTPAQIEQTIARGDLYFAAVHQGQVIHLEWLVRGTAWLPDLHAGFALGAAEAYGANAFTAPEHRGRGVHPAVLDHVLRQEKSLGIRAHFAYVRKSSPSATRALAKHQTENRVWVLRCYRFAGIRGRLITGLDQPGMPRLEFPTGFRTRSMDALGRWISPPPGHRLSWSMVPPGTTPVAQRSRQARPPAPSVRS